jgi:hypothetical protein
MTLSILWRTRSCITRRYGALEFPVEMHLYAKGGHAFGLRRTSSPITGWPELVEQWLGSIGMIPK